MKKKFTLPISDLKDLQEYTRSPKDIYDKDQDNQSRKKNILKYKFDLHGYSLNDANKKVSEIINFCSEKNYSEILLITGKGLHSEENDVFKSKELSKVRKKASLDYSRRTTQGRQTRLHTVSKLREPYQLNT